MVPDSLSKREKQVFLCIVEDARLSDQEIARRIQTSRPTVSRIRQRLEKQGYLKGYMPRVNIDLLGLKIRSMMLYRWKDLSKKEELARVESYVRKLPCVTTAAKGSGFDDRTNLIWSVHKSLEDHAKFIAQLREVWADNVDNVEIFLMSSTGASKYTDYTGLLRDTITIEGA